MPRPSSPTRRADILAAARDAFNARGFAGARLDDIARAVGVSKAALYLQFASKEALFEASVRELIEQTLPEAIPADFTGQSASALLRRFIGFAFERLASKEMAFVPRVIIGEGMNFPELARFYHDEVVNRILGVIEAVLRHGVEQGEFSCPDPALARRSIAGGIVFGALWKIVFEPAGGEPLDIAAMARVHADTLLDGLLKRGELPA